jgi:hypothetical protein
MKLKRGSTLLTKFVFQRVLRLTERANQHSSDDLEAKNKAKKGDLFKK